MPQDRVKYDTLACVRAYVLPFFYTAFAGFVLTRGYPRIHSCNIPVDKQSRVAGGPIMAQDCILDGMFILFNFFSLNYFRGQTNCIFRIFLMHYMILHQLNFSKCKRCIVTRPFINFINFQISSSSFIFFILNNFFEIPDFQALFNILSDFDTQVLHKLQLSSKHHYIKKIKNFQALNTVFAFFRNTFCDSYIARSPKSRCSFFFGIF